jgi:hypothetical protein
MFERTEKWFELTEHNVWRHVGSGESELQTTVQHTLKDHFQAEINKERALLATATVDGGIDIFLRIRRLERTSRAIRTATATILRDLRCMYSVDNAGMDANDQLFAFSDCVLDLKTGVTRPIEPADRILTTTGYPYPQHADPTALAEVRTVLDDMLGSAALRSIAVCLAGQPYSSCTFLSGNGGNGKSTLLSLMRAAFGEYMTVIDGLLPVRANRCCQGKRVVMFMFESVFNSSIPLQADALVNQLIMWFQQRDIDMKFGLFVETDSRPELPARPTRREYHTIQFPIRFTPFPRADRPNEKLLDTSVAQRCRSDPKWRDAFVRLLMDAYAESV